MRAGKCKSGSTDAAARIMAERMRSTLGQSIVIENVGGAGGSIGVGRVARSAPDGYTLAIGHNQTHVINGASMNLPYDVVKDFEPISLIADTPQWLISRKTLPANNVKELIAWLKANPDSATQGTAGPGSGQHVSGVYFQTVTGARYKFDLETVTAGVEEMGLSRVMAQFLGAVCQSPPGPTNQLATRFGVDPGWVTDIVDRLEARGDLVRRRGPRVLAIAGLVNGTVAVLGPIIGVAMMFVTPASLGLSNLVSSLVYVFVLPAVGITLALLFYDLRIRKEGEQVSPASLPRRARVRPDTPEGASPSAAPQNA
jgi:hypothetical protein